jgi:pyruvate formate-lyase activating enzyme-like uncharacterized protein
MLNDYVQISNGRIINIGFEVDLFIDKQFSQAQIIAQVIDKTTEFVDVNKFQMGENIYLSSLLEIINNVGGVLNITDLRVFNKVGGNYSVNEIAQPYSDNESRQIDISEDYTLFGEPNSMFECLTPSVDIIIRSKA